MATTEPSPSLLQKVKPRTARSARALKHREPQTLENPKVTLLLQYTTCSQLIQLLLSDIFALKRPLAIRFTKKNPIHPFEDASSLEFFSQKNDASLIVFGSSSKKRPHTLTLLRTFEHQVLDMLELYLDPESLRTLSQFKNERKAAVGLKPLLAFCGTAWEGPVQTDFTLAKSILTDLFKGPDVTEIDVEGLQYMICFSVEEEDSSSATAASSMNMDGASKSATTPSTTTRKPQIHLRTYLLRTRRAPGSKLPHVTLEEMGPRASFRIGRTQQPDAGMWKEAMKRPRTSEPRLKKNVETDLMGDKVGRIHVGKQDLKGLQTRKMRGLKRGRGEGYGDGQGVGEGEMDVDVDGDRDAGGTGGGAGGGMVGGKRPRIGGS